MTQFTFKFADKKLLLGNGMKIMGILNVTPDSFSDGGEFVEFDSAIQQAMQMVDDGADIIDVGGESTRPGAAKISTEEEINRVIPIIKGLSALSSVPISIDTCKAQVARLAIEAGATIVNDVSGLHYDKEMVEVIAQTGAGAILMHMRGKPKNMQKMTEYGDIISEICDYFENILQKTDAAGIARDRIVLDPGIGFAKKLPQNLQLIANTKKLKSLHQPILLGPSRKTFIGELLQRDDAKLREWGTAGAVAACLFCEADIVRVHNVKNMRDVVTVLEAILKHCPNS